MAVKPKLCSRKKTAAERVDQSALVILARGGQYHGTCGQKSKVAGLKSRSHQADNAHEELAETAIGKSASSERVTHKDALSQLQSPLFQLAPELRDKIWECCAGVCMSQDGVNYFLTTPLTWGTCKYPALLMTCKRLNREAREFIISSDVEIHFTRLGVFLKTVGVFNPTSVRRLHVFHSELVNPYLMSVNLERVIRSASTIESAQLTTYASTSSSPSHGPILGKYLWERPGRHQKHGIDYDMDSEVRQSHPIDLITGVSCWNDRAVVDGFHLPANKWPHQKWMVIQMTNKRLALHSLDLTLNLAIRRQSQWQCTYLSPVLARTLASVIKDEADFLAKSENR